jgi:hypothetical protein
MLKRAIYFSPTIYGYVRAPGGKITAFNLPGSTDTEPQSINSTGSITGSYLSKNYQHVHGFLRSP